MQQRSTARAARANHEVAHALHDAIIAAEVNRNLRPLVVLHFRSGAAVSRVMRESDDATRVHHRHR
jgi:hypothetical protein